MNVRGLCACFLVWGCTKGQPAAQTPGQERTERTSQGFPKIYAEKDSTAVEGTASDQAPSTNQTEEKFEALCAGMALDCENHGAIENWILAGDSERAESALGEIRGQMGGTPTAPERALELLLSGWLLLETDSLSYGAGGEIAREALRQFERGLSILSEAPGADWPGVAARLALQKARAQLALGRGEAALSSLKRLADRYRAEAEVQAALGIAYLSVGRVPESLSPLRRAARLDPSRPERHAVLGTAQMLAGQYGEAEQSYLRALSKNADDPRIHGDLGALLLLMGRVPEGKQQLERAVELAPGQATFLTNLAYAELLAQEPQRCEERARQALSLDARLASAWLNLGLCLVALGQHEQARRSFEKAAELDPTDPRPRNNLRDLDELLAGKTPP